MWRFSLFRLLFPIRVFKDAFIKSERAVLGSRKDQATLQLGLHSLCEQHNSSGIIDMRKRPEYDFSC